MGMRVLAPGMYRRMPWRNGRGMTTELAREPEDGMGNFLWRISISEVSRQGPFSLFPGYDRCVAVIEGDGMDLLLDGSIAERLGYGDPPCSFSGDRLAECRLVGGMIRDFNLIVDRSRGRGALHRIRKGPTLTAGGGGSVVLVYVVAGETWVRVQDGNDDLRFRLEQEYTLLLDNAAVEVSCTASDAEALVSEITMVNTKVGRVCIEAVGDQEA